jgi:long-subunit acyl-CoA synthetase (AMP-forming)
MPQTVWSVLESTAAEHPDRPAMKTKENGAWRAVSWREYREQAALAARGFLSLGLAPGQGVAILGFNRPEWFLADVGAIAAGGLPAGIYSTSTPEQIRYIAAHAGVGIAVVEDERALATIQAVRAGLPDLRSIVLMRGEPQVPDGGGVISWRELLERGAAVPEERLRERLAAQRPEDPCTLIYTSGTTGPPKAVTLSHHNIVWTARQVVESYRITRDDDFLSYLPLSHIAEQVVSLHSPMATGACSWFAESLEKLGDNLREVKPTVFFAVPRVWEKMQAGIQAAGAQNPPLKRRIAAWARGVGLAAGEAAQKGGGRPALYPLARKLVFSKVRERLGLERARVCATSTAPIALETLQLFQSLDIPVLEVYGMSECTGPATFSTPERYRLGRAGFAIPGTELKTAEDGELLIRGPHVFLGYYKDEAATREALSEDGWLRTGDIGKIGDVGEIDAPGFLRITDRKKELIITSGGKNIGPAILENKLKQIAAVSQAVVVGDRRNYLTALLTLDPERAAAEAEKAGSPARVPRDLAVCPTFRRYLEQQVEEVNKTLARYETIKRFAILPRELSVEEGELTPTLKLKRRVVLERYKAEIEGLYT